MATIEAQKLQLSDKKEVRPEVLFWALSETSACYDNSEINIIFLSLAVWDSKSVI